MFSKVIGSLFVLKAAGLQLEGFPWTGNQAKASDCRAYMESEGCGWTLDYNCPSQALRALGAVNPDKIEDSFECCCNQKLWRQATLGDITLADAGAAECPLGYNIITEGIDECNKAAEALGDRYTPNAEYGKGRLGAASPKGCFLNGGNNQVLFNYDNMDAPKNIKSAHHYVCKRVLEEGANSRILTQSSATAPKITKLPHIVFVLVDDLGVNDIGVKRKGLHTPALDAFAKSSVELSQYYAYSECAPSRFSFLTGRYGFRSDSIVTNFPQEMAVGTNLAYTMLPAALQAKGYKTHMVGKWHQGFHRKEYLPTSRGFDTFFGFVGGSADHMDQKCPGCGGCKFNGNGIVDLFVGEEPAYGLAGEHSGEQYYRHAVAMIQNHSKYFKDEPMFMYFALQDVHAPYQVPDKYSNKYTHIDEVQNIYDGMISLVDNSFYQVISALKESDMWDDSLVIFTSDNGASASSPNPDSNKPLRGHMGSQWEGGIRVPAYVGGGLIPKKQEGKTLNGLFSIADWYATFAYLTGATIDDQGPGGKVSSDAINQWLYLSGEDKKSPRDSIIHSYNALTKTGALRKGDWKLVVQPEAEDTGVCSIQKPCLFNIPKDASERYDVALTEDGVLAEMKGRWAALTHEYASQEGASVYLQHRDAWSKKACLKWQSADGFLVPWADKSDELGQTKLWR